MRLFWILCGLAAFLVLAPSLVSSQDDRIKLMEAVSRNVKDVCQSPSEKGRYWDIDIEGGGEARVRLKLANLGVSGQAEFTKGEWEGVQQVLKEQQAEENKNYRECAQKLTPLFIEKLVPSRFEPESVAPRQQRLSNKVKARIVSRSDSNKVTIRLGSCNSTLTRTVDAGLTVTVIRHQSPDCNGFFRIADDGGNVLGWIPKDRIELLGPIQE